MALFASLAIGLNGLFLAIFIGLADVSLWICVLAFLLLSLTTLFLFVQKARFTITEKGIAQQLKPLFKWWSVESKELDRHYSWGRLQSFEDDTETTRYNSTRRYLKLKMDDGYLMRIDEGDVSGADDFAQFMQVFYSYTGLSKGESGKDKKPAMGRIRSMYDYKAAHITLNHSTSHKPRQENHSFSSLFLKATGLVFSALALALLIIALVSWITDPGSEEWIRIVSALLVFSCFSAYLLYVSFYKVSKVGKPT